MKSHWTKKRKIDYLFIKPSAYCFKYFWPFLVIAFLFCFPLTTSIDSYFRTSAVFNELYNSYPSFDTWGTVITVYAVFMGIIYFLFYKLSKHIVSKKRCKFKDYYFALEKNGVSVSDEEYQFYMSAWNLSQEVEQLRNKKVKSEKPISTDPDLDCFTKDAFDYAWKYRRGRVISIPIVGALTTMFFTLANGFAGVAVLVTDYFFFLVFLFLALYIFTALQMEKEKESHWELLRLMEFLNILYLVNGDMEKARAKRKEIEEKMEVMV